MATPSLSTAGIRPTSEKQLKPSHGRQPSAARQSEVLLPRRSERVASRGYLVFQLALTENLTQKPRSTRNG
jgi:hypothetical protein